MCNFLQEHKRGQSVLHEAVNRQDMDVVNAVISSRSLDINLQTYDSLTALDMAISRRWTEGEKVLVLAGGLTADDNQLVDMDWLVALLSEFSINQSICFRPQRSITVEDKGQKNDRIYIRVTDRNTLGIFRTPCALLTLVARAYLHHLLVITYIRR